MASKLCKSQKCFSYDQQLWTDTQKLLILLITYIMAVFKTPPENQKSGPHHFRSWLKKKKKRDSACLEELKYTLTTETHLLHVSERYFMYCVFIFVPDLPQVSLSLTIHHVSVFPQDLNNVKLFRCVWFLSKFFSFNTFFPTLRCIIKSTLIIKGTQSSFFSAEAYKTRI